MLWTAGTVHHAHVTTDERVASARPLTRPYSPRHPEVLSRSRLLPVPFHPLLLAAYPILLLFAENQAEVPLGEVVEPIVGAALAVCLITLVAGIVLRDLRRGAIIASALALVWFTFYQVALVVRPLGILPTVQVALSLGIVMLCVYITARARPATVERLTIGIDAVALVLVSLTLVNIVPYQLAHPVAAGTAVNTLARPSPAPGARDIYFFVFDRYGDREALSVMAGVDNDLPGWLEQQGFEVAMDAHANYGRTNLSLAATLNMTYLDHLAAEVGPDSSDPRPSYDMIQDHAVGRFLQEHGYRYINVGNWYGPTKSIRMADENRVMPGTSDFGELLDQTTLSATIDILRGIPSGQHRRHRAVALFGLAEFDQVRLEPGPKFVMMHFLLPHEPYVFAADGSYPGLTGMDANLSPAGLRGQLRFANDRIREMVAKLLAVPEAERPIIIIQGDEGPYPDRYARDQEGFDWATATPEELQTKYGVLAAMYLPGVATADAPAVYPDMTLINTFPIVLDRYFDAGIPLLPDRIYTSATLRRPYDLTDVTARLAGP
jgi:hypothetical protein